VYLTCCKKLTGSQLSLPHRINEKLKCETKNIIMMSVIGPVQCHYHEAVQQVKEGENLWRLPQQYVLQALTVTSTLTLA